jgi:ribosomal protein L11 methylase PrmA
MFQILSRVAAVVGLVLVPLALCDGTAEEVKKPSAPARTPDCVYVGTPHDVIDMMVEQAAIQKSDLVYDLGCGDARILVAAARRHGCRCVGYDINPLRIEEALERIQKNKVADLVKVEQQDIFTLDLKDADVIMLYLLPKMNEKLIPQLEKLKPGARIVCHDYSIKGIAHEKSLSVNSLEDGAKHEIYVYKAPLKKES